MNDQPDKSVLTIDAEDPQQQRIRVLFDQRIKIKSLEDALKAEKDAWSTNAKQLLTDTGYDSIKAEHFGSITLVRSSRSSLDQSILKQVLLANNVAADIINMAIDRATKVTPSESVRYFPVKS